MTFRVQIVTPDGLFFDGQVERLTVPTIDGQVGILARHVNYVTALGMGPAKILTPDGERVAACIGGMIAVTNGEAKVVATTFEWADQIDVARAQASLERARAELAVPNLDPVTMQVHKARQNRALVRLNVAKNAAK